MTSRAQKHCGTTPAGQTSSSASMMSISASIFYPSGPLWAPFWTPKWTPLSFRKLTFSHFFRHFFTFVALEGQTGPQGRPRHQNGAQKGAPGPKMTRFPSPWTLKILKKHKEFIGFRENHDFRPRHQKVCSKASKMSSNYPPGAPKVASGAPKVIS